MFLRKGGFLECRQSKSEFDLGSAFFGISEIGFLPYGVQMKGVIEKAWNFNKKCSFLKKVGISPREGARTIENIRRIRINAARASGTDLASSLRQNTFLIERIDF